MNESRSPSDRPLTPAEQRRIDAARRKAFVLYDGRLVAHRSCGVALAETFGIPARTYSALRRGGITGEGECGAIKAGELVLGECLGEADPLAPVAPAHREAAQFYRSSLRGRVDLGRGGEGGSIVCNDLTAPFGEFTGEPRHEFCTSLVTEVAGLVCETLIRFGHDPKVDPVPEANDER